MSLVAATKRTTLYILCGVALVVSMAALFALPAAVHAQPAPAPPPAPPAGTTTGLCFDGLAGAATRCPDTPSERYPVDGKLPGTFDKSKCYRILDPAKGWETFSCTDAVFKDVIDTVKVGDVTDNAEKGECAADLDPDKKCDVIALYLNPIINAMTAFFVLIVVGAIIIGGIQYSASADQPQAAAAAKGRIINAIIALVGFIFLWAFLQWVVPGGLL